MKTIFALFNQDQNSRKAIRELLDKDFDLKEMSLIFSTVGSKNPAPDEQNQAGASLAQTMVGQELHGFDQLLGTHQRIEIDNSLDIYAVGDLANVFAETTSDTGGNLKLALKHFNIDDETAASYQDGVKNGRLLFFMRAFDERANEALEVLRKHGAKFISHQTPMQQ